MKKILILLFVALSFWAVSLPAYAEDDISNYTTLREIDKDTFNEYRYKMTEQFFILRDKFEINGFLDEAVLREMASVATQSYKYLPDNLKNKNYLQALGTAITRWIKFPNNDANYTAVIQAISDYLEKVDIQSVKWSIQAVPLKWNAPLTVTFRWKVTDPTGSTIPARNYVWWMNRNGQRVNIGTGQSLTYTFTEEGNFSVFADVVSGHKNEAWYTDVLPFSSRADVQVDEKIASLIIKVNGDRLYNQDVLKFTPAESSYGLIFDATSSTPTSGTTFLTTEWDFGNGVEKEYDGSPRIERIKYASEWEYTVKLKLKTNDLKFIEKVFVIDIHDPIATVSASSEEGFVGDKFTFSAKAWTRQNDLSYAWEIVDIDNDAILFNKSGKNFNYVFTTKWKFNVKLQVTEPSWETDIDTKIIYINSRSPVAAFSSSILETNKPNKVFLDGSRSYDPDFIDDGKLKFNWYINGNKVVLDSPNSNGSTGYYTFDSVGSHSVNLEVIDPDGISALKKQEVKVNSILAVEVFAFPRVIQREWTIKFVADSPEAEIFEWDFGDGTKKWTDSETISHIYTRSWVFDMKLQVLDDKWNTNKYNKTVYIGESEVPLALATVSVNGTDIPEFDASACNSKWAYVVDRVSNLRFDAGESINIDGTTNKLGYSWKIGNTKYATTATVNHKFDELGCFPVKLTVKSEQNAKTSTELLWMDVRNLTPVLTSLDIDVTNPDGDPLVVSVKAQWAEDPDGVIQSYLWYYYTDIDSEPQDFRSTLGSATTFVLPKITGNYYFVAILKDNNEEKVHSEELTSSKFFTTITGDNLDTPLVELAVNDSALSIGEDVVYTAKVKNILGQDLSKKVKYSWDFDGDGFYDKETSTPSVTHKFSVSGTTHSKVKVKYKGISSTKTVTINVANQLTPDFGYISIWNKFVFFDKSKGQIDSLQWNLGDETKSDKDSLVHTYSDGKNSHKVTLKISEGTKTKEVTKTVLRNMKNVIVSRRANLNVFTSPAVGEDWTVVLTEAGQDLFVYSGDSNAEIKGYAIDYDIEVDSDLNGGKDDDEDNKGTWSYLDGSIASVELNNRRNQTIRVFIMDETGNVLDSEDIIIVKEYIEEQEIDLDTIVFEWISESQKEKIDALKTIISGLEQNNRIVAMSYVQKLQEEWFDDTEKTRIIIDFEIYLDENTPEIADEAIELLGSLLVEGQEDKSARNISFNALKNLIPETVTCEQPEGYTGCSEYLISTLESIKNSWDIEDNKILGSEILSVVATSETMSTSQKLDFKAILKNLVYGSVDNIPEEERLEIENDTSGQEEIDTEPSKVIDILTTIVKWLGIFIGVFLLVALAYFIYYKISNKDSGVGFTDFIKKKTSADDVATEEDDILSELGWVIEENKTEALASNDVLSEVVESPKVVEEKEQDWVPDWLSGNFDEESRKTPEKKVEIPAPKVEEKKVEQLKTPEVKKEEPKSSNKEENKTEVDVPDWLKGDVWESKNTKKDNVKNREVKNKKEETSLPDPSLITDENIDAVTSLDDSEVPSWLKQDFSKIEWVDKKPKAEAPAKKDKIQLKDSIKSKGKQESLNQSGKKKQSNKATPKKEVVQKIKEIPKAEKTSKKKKEERGDLKKNDTLQVDAKASENKKSDPHLPDWLADSFVEDTPKADAIKAKDTKTPVKAASLKTEDKKPSPKKQVKENPKPEAGVPDWLKSDLETPQNVPQPKQATSKKAVKEGKISSVENSGKSNLKDTPKSVDVKTVDTGKSEKKSSELWDDGMEVPDWLKS